MAGNGSNNKGASGTEVQRTAFTECMKSVNTAIPGHVLAFDPATQRAQIQIGIQRVDINGITWVPQPIVDVPVHFPGGDFSLEYEIKTGCEGLIIFSQRCVDAWKQTGGAAENPAGRFHDSQDAFFIPGFRPLPKIINNFSNDGIKLRNQDGTQYAWLKGDGSVAVGNAEASINIMSNGLVNIFNASGSIQLMADGTVNMNGFTIAPDGTTTIGGIDWATHRHTGVQTGGGTSGGPV